MGFFVFCCMIWLEDEGDGKSNIVNFCCRASTQFATKWHLQMREINKF